MKPPVCAWLLAALVVVAAAQDQALPPPALPLMTEALKEELPKYRFNEGGFWRLWEYALRHDLPPAPPAAPPGSPAIPRGSGVEARTVLAPSSSAESNLIPQDAGDVRFGSSPPLRSLRRGYLLDHLLLEPLSPTDPRLSLPDGASLTTASGKSVTLTQDEKGVVSINGVASERVETLADGTVIYFLSDILFDNRARVTEAFHAVHTPGLATDPLGPPLPLPHRPVIRAPAPPPPGTPGIARPPAIPLDHAVIRAPASPTGEPQPPASPPAIPPDHAIFRAPAPPTGEEPRPPAPPVGPKSPRTSEAVSPPAPLLPNKTERAPAPPPAGTPRLQ